MQTPANADDHVFLFLQGPHGPFFQSLGRLLKTAGATVWRVGFNSGDAAFWRDRASYIPYRGSADDWPGAIDRLLEKWAITDLVVYGDSRACHVAAIAATNRRGLRVHVFEEGYLRPYWITYERAGSNGNSRLMSLSVDQMRAALARTDAEVSLPPGHWGDMREHMFYGALYHWFVMFRNRRYPHFEPHRGITAHREFRLQLHRLLRMPVHALARYRATLRIQRGSFPYHLALLQLEHDSSFQVHSPFSTMTDFLDLVVSGFARGAPRHHHLVFKAHPLEDGRVPLRRHIRRLARAHGILDRVHFVPGGKLARLLDDAASVVTVNSTAGQQALWRGLPLKTFGRSVYDKPELVSDQPLTTFFASPRRPDAAAYKDFRQFLLATSQVPGGYYSFRGRRQLLRRIIDMMLAAQDPYDALTEKTAAAGQQVRLVL